MFLLRDNIPTRNFPAVNTCLIAVNLLVYLHTWRLGDRLQPFLVHYGFIPLRLSVTGGDVLSVLTIFTSMFLHGSLLHLLANLWVLWIFGPALEGRLGHGGYLVLYLLGGMAAVTAQYWSAPKALSPMVGASGAIAGVLGAYLVSFPRAKILTFLPLFFFFSLIEVPASLFLGLWFLLQAIQGSLTLLGGAQPDGGVAWWAHLGGFGSGILLLAIFRTVFRCGVADVR